MNTTNKISMMDIENREALDRLINNIILDDAKIEVESPLGKSSVDLIALLMLVNRLKERTLYIGKYKDKEFSTSVSAIEYTGDPIQEVLIEHWLRDRRVYFLKGYDYEEDFFFAPSNSASVNAKVGEIIILTKAGGLSACTKEEFNNKFEYDDNLGE